MILYLCAAMNECAIKWFDADGKCFVGSLTRPRPKYRRQRLYGAWLVLLGKADALIWGENDGN